MYPCWWHNKAVLLVLMIEYIVENGFNWCWALILTSLGPACHFALLCWSKWRDSFFAKQDLQELHHSKQAVLTTAPRPTKCLGFELSVQTNLQSLRQCTPIREVWPYFSFSALLPSVSHFAQSSHCAFNTDVSIKTVQVSRKLTNCLHNILYIHISIGVEAMRSTDDDHQLYHAIDWTDQRGRNIEYVQYLNPPGIHLPRQLFLWGLKLDLLLLRLVLSPQLLPELLAKN